MTRSRIHARPHMATRTPACAAGGPTRWLVWLLLACAMAAGVSLASSCSSGSEHAATSSPGVAKWVDEAVSFPADGMVIYATYRHPVPVTAAFPAALLIAGSGPTDRNGNTAAAPGAIDTLKTVADWLSDDGVASLRYDKLGSGATGLGPYAAAPATIGLAPFEDEASAALAFLARQPGVDPARLAVFGHSEGALFTLLLATGAAGPAPKIKALGLLEPLSVRYLDVISAQIEAQIRTAEQSKTLLPAAGAALEGDLAAAVAAVRKGSALPPDLPNVLASLFNANTVLFLSQADRYDPAQLAAQLPPHTPVLVTCSNADTQVTCGEVNHLADGLAKASADTDFVHLTGVDHVLKEDPTGSPANYTNPLPFSAQLKAALAAFVKQHLQSQGSPH